MSPEEEKILKKILRTIINSMAGLKHVIVIDDTGIAILSQSKFVASNENDLSVEKIAAISSGVFLAGEEQGKILEYGDIDLQITEYLNGIIFSIKAGRGILCVATDENVNLGFLRTLLKKWAPQIAKILNKYLETGKDETSKELKELFKFT